MKNKKGNAVIVIIIFILILILVMATYFMFFSNNKMDNNLNNNSNQDLNDNEVDIYKNNINNNNEIIESDIEIEDKNANEIYKRVKKGIKYNGKYVEVPKDYMDKLLNKIGEKGYKLKDESKEYINKKLDDIEKNISESRVEDINDLNESTKEKIKMNIKDIESKL